MMKTNIKAFALRYAEALVAYHTAQNSDRATPDSNRRAYNALCDAQNALDAAASRVACEQSPAIA